MNKELKISVCMATYNGDRYISEQLISILKQLNIEDEVIIIDDNSDDTTTQIIENLNDSRIHLYKNKKNKGYIFSFARAIALAKNEIIFLSDQDDIWILGRKVSMIRELENSGKMLVSSNFIIVDPDGNNETGTKYHLKQTDSNNNIKNILKIFSVTKNYFGCAMAFKKELKNIILPIPNFVESHDLWIAMAANILHSNWHMEGITLKKRIHGNNVSVYNRSLIDKINSRIIFIKSIIIIYHRKTLLNKKNSMV